MDGKIINVAFITEKLKEDFDKLKKGKFESKELYKFISRAIEDLKQNPQIGIRVPTRLIPQKYSQKYALTNLWKYNLPNAWRLLYSVIGDEIKIVSVILDWMDHKDYERLFGY